MPHLADIPRKIVDVSKIPKTGRVKNGNWTPAPVDPQEVEWRRANKKIIQAQEELMPIAPEGVEPFVDENGEVLELPFVCEEGKARQKGQVSMTESKKAYITRERENMNFGERKYIGQLDFIAAQGTEPKYGQLKHYLDDYGQREMPFCTRTTPHKHDASDPTKLIRMDTMELCEKGANHGRTIKKLTKAEFDEIMTHKEENNDP